MSFESDIPDWAGWFYVEQVSQLRSAILFFSPWGVSIPQVDSNGRFSRHFDQICCLCFGLILSWFAFCRYFVVILESFRLGFDFVVGVVVVLLLFVVISSSFCLFVFN